jgi:hypothetical protein
MVLYGLAREPIAALAASAIARASWIGALATLSVSAQVALPDWVRACYRRRRGGWRVLTAVAQEEIGCRSTEQDAVKVWTVADLLARDQRQ